MTRSPKRNRAPNLPRIPRPKTPIEIERPLVLRFEMLQLQPIGVSTNYILSSDFVIALLAKLRAICHQDVETIFYPEGNEHQLGLEDLQRPGPICDRNGNENIQFQEGQPWQLCLEGDKQNRWRIHGYILQDSFYLVWLDPEHNLFDRASKPHKQKR